MNKRWRYLLYLLSINMINLSCLIRVSSEDLQSSILFLKSSKKVTNYLKLRRVEFAFAFADYLQKKRTGNQLMFVLKMEHQVVGVEASKTSKITNNVSKNSTSWYYRLDDDHPQILVFYLIDLFLWFNWRTWNIIVEMRTCVNKKEQSGWQFDHWSSQR